MKSRDDIARQVQELRQLGSEIINRASRLEQELAPPRAPAPRKGKSSRVQEAVDKRNRRLGLST